MLLMGNVPARVLSTTLFVIVGKSNIKVSTTGEQLSEIQSVTRNISAAYSRHQALFVQLMANQAHVDTHSFIYRMTKESGHPSIPHVASRA